MYGNGLFLSGFLGALLSSMIVPTFFDAIATAFSGWPDIPSDTIQAIGWIGLIIIWIIAMIALPVIVTIYGLRQEGQESKGWWGQQGTKLKGILWMVFSLLIIYGLHRYLNFFLTLANTIPTGMTIITIMYWFSVVIVIVSNTILVPGYILFKVNED